MGIVRVRASVEVDLKLIPARLFHVVMKLSLSSGDLDHVYRVDPLELKEGAKFNVLGLVKRFFFVRH